QGCCSVLVLDLLPVGDLTLVDAQREAALGIGARPRLEDHRGALLAVVGQRNQGSVVTFLALGKFHHPSSRPDAPARQSRIQPVECRQTLLAKQALARLSTGSASAPERNRTSTPGSGGLCDIHFTTGARAGRLSQASPPRPPERPPAQGGGGFGGEKERRTAASMSRSGPCRCVFEAAVSSPARRWGCPAKSVTRPPAS